MSKLITITIAIDMGLDFCQEHTLEVPEHTTVGDALSSFSNNHSIKIDLPQQKIGIFGLATSLDTPLQDRDRLEVYQPLKIDPKQARRIRAERAKVKR